MAKPPQTTADKLAKVCSKMPARLQRVEGLTSKNVESLRTSLNESLDILDDLMYVGLDKWYLLVEERRIICLTCEHLRGELCRQIKKERGCSSCNRPWVIRYNSCPKNNWS